MANLVQQQVGFKAGKEGDCYKEGAIDRWAKEKFAAYPTAQYEQATKKNESCDIEWTQIGYNYQCKLCIRDNCVARDTIRLCVRKKDTAPEPEPKPEPEPEPKPKKFVCPYCGLDFPTKALLREHIAVAHPDKSSDSEDKKWLIWIPAVLAVIGGSILIAKRK